MLAINNLASEYKNIDEKFLIKIAKKVLLKEKISAKRNLSIALVEASEIKKLNKIYRGKNKETDVLSFGKLKNEPVKFKDFSEPEIIICPKDVWSNAKKEKELFKKELARVLVHGILHLLGYDHERGENSAKKMFQKQEEYLSLFDFNSNK